MWNELKILIPGKKIKQTNKQTQLQYWKLQSLNFVLEKRRKKKKNSYAWTISKGIRENAENLSLNTSNLKLKLPSYYGLETLRGG